MEKSKNFIEGLLDKEIKKFTLKPEEKYSIQNNFTFTDDLNSFKNTDFIIEVNLIILKFSRLSVKTYQSNKIYLLN